MNALGALGGIWIGIDGVVCMVILGITGGLIDKSVVYVYTICQLLQRTYKCSSPVPQVRRRIFHGADMVPIKSLY